MHDIYSGKAPYNMLPRLLNIQLQIRSAQPSGKPLDIMGINHYHVLNGKVKEEWMTFDGLDVLKQMAMGSDEQEE